MKIRKNLLTSCLLFIITGFITLTPAMQPQKQDSNQLVILDVIAHEIDITHFDNIYNEIDEEISKTNDLLFLLEAKNDDGYYRVDSIVIK